MAAKSPYFSTAIRKSKSLALDSLKAFHDRTSRKRTIKIKYEDENENQLESPTSAEPVKKKNVKKLKDQEIRDNVSLCDTLVNKASWQPKDWTELLGNIKEMRKDRTAVVDSQGCERTADLWEIPEVIRYQTLVSLMLSSQTKDQVTFAAVKRLKEHGLTIPHIIKTSEKKIGELIYPVGFWKRKAKYILDAARICHDRFNDDIPDTIVGLTSLPGVGPKMAYICMTAAWGKVEGIGVDTHVHRIANRLEFMKNKTKTPEQTRLSLESWLPRSEWKDINILLVGFGQQTCLPLRPKCSGCLNRNICPSSTAKNEKL